MQILNAMIRLSRLSQRTLVIGAVTWVTACVSRTDIQQAYLFDSGFESALPHDDAPSDSSLIPDHDSCNYQSCTGCCDPQGWCRIGIAPEACGNRGSTCVDCTKTNEICDRNFRTCIAKEISRCNSSNCSGCCDQNNVCHTQGSNKFCGIGATACKDCTINNHVCNTTQGQCQHGFIPPCDHTSCPDGCCDSTNMCLSGLSAFACGTNGKPCAECDTLNDFCDPELRICVSVTYKCSRDTCPLGCCFSDTICASGVTDEACGTDGQFCTRCSADQQCDAKSRQCVSKYSDCNPSNCKGCCDMSNTCRTGTDNDACGSEGQVCVNCSFNSMTCSPSTRTCMGSVKCNATTCIGCCDATTHTCLSGTEATGCGERAEVCQNCASDNGVCIAGTFGGGLCIAEGPSQQCNAETCTGCCDCSMPGSCTCRNGTEPAACGHNARVCQKCDATSNTLCQPLAGGGGSCKLR